MVENQESVITGKIVTVHQRRPILSIFDGQYISYLWLKKADFVKAS